MILERARPNEAASSRADAVLQGLAGAGDRGALEEVMHFWRVFIADDSAPCGEKRQDGL